MDSEKEQKGTLHLDKEASVEMVRTSDHVLASWFPANAELLQSIQSGIASGRYEGDTEALISDIKSDFSLFTYCTRELIRILRSDFSGASTRKNPVELMREAGIETLKEILSVDDSDISIHQISGLSPAQAIRFKEAMTSASVGELLAESMDVDPDLVFSCALFRQLGLTLIAWNYPHLYARHYSNNTAEPVDKILARTLGFSPMMLGLSIASKWGICPEIRFAMGENPTGPMTAETINAKSVAETVEKICRIGEIFARYTAPDPPTESTTEWEQAKDAVRTQLGSSGFRILEKRMAESCRHYLSYAPDFFKISELTKIRETIEETTSDLLARNHYVRLCGQPIRSKLESLYSRIAPPTISKDAVDLLIKDIIPAAGFSLGYVYLVELDTFSLVPRLAIGEASLSKASQIQYRVSGRTPDPIVKAYLSNVPVLDEIRRPDGRSALSVAGSLGVFQRAGVLYLETAPDAEVDPQISPEKYFKLLFKAIRQALTDCLNLY